jgi:hypothetical protein
VHVRLGLQRHLTAETNPFYIQNGITYKRLEIDLSRQRNSYRKPILGYQMETSDVLRDAT